VEDALDAGHRSANGSAIGHVTDRPLELEALELAGLAFAPGQQAQVIASLGECARDVRADESGRSGDQCLPHTAMVDGGDLIDRRAMNDESSARTSVVVDTTAYLPDELIADLGIHRISLYVTLDGEEKRESEIEAAEYDSFYERLSKSSGGATTSQPSVGDFTSIYEPLLGNGGEVVSIHLSAGISGTYQSATQARQALIDEGKGGERVHVYDSRSAAGGAGLVTIAAARAAKAGASGEAALAAADRARDGLKMWFAIDTLEYLRKGGRIGAAQAWMGSALQIKPILTLEEEITPVERVRTRRRAFERMVEFGRERHDAGATAWVVQHIHDHETARHLVDECRQIFGSEPVFVSEIGPVIGAHIGPGLLGVGGIDPELLG